MYNNLYWDLFEDPTQPRRGGMAVHELPVVQRDGYGIYYSPNIYGAIRDEANPALPRRTAENVTHITCVFADFDNPLKDGKKDYTPETVESFVQKTLADVEMTVSLAPTSIVRTGKGLHYRWDFNEPVAISSRLKELYTHIPGFLESDPACKDVNRVLRMPNTTHWGSGKPLPVTVLKENADNTYSVEEIERAFGFMPSGTIPKPSESVDEDSVWVKYNDDPRYTFDELLLPLGWKKVKKEYYTRPGKDSGISAHLIDGEVFYVFTSSVPGIEANTAYSKAFLLCHLKYKGDVTSTAKYLHSLYPDPVVPVAAVKPLIVEAIPEYCLRGYIGQMVEGWGERDLPSLFASVLIAGGAVGKQKFRVDKSYIKPVLYLMLTGRPSSGKSVYVAIVESIMKQLEIKAGSSPESGQALVRIACGFVNKPEDVKDEKTGKMRKVDKLVTTPMQATLFAIDEFNTCVKAGSGASSILMEKMRNAHQCRSLGTSSLSNARDLGNGEVISVEDPYIYIMAGITSSELQALMKNSEFETGGLASRFLFANTVYKKRKATDLIAERSNKFNETALLSAANAIVVTQPKFGAQELSITDIMPMDIAVYDGVVQAKYGLTVDNEESDAHNRAELNARAISFIYMLQDGRTTLCREDIDAGWWIVAQSIKIYEYNKAMSRQIISEDKKESNMAALRSILLEAIIAFGPCTLRDITQSTKYKRKLASFTSDTLKTQLEAMVQSGDISEGEKDVNGRKYQLFTKAR